MTTSWRDSKTTYVISEKKTREIVTWNPNSKVIKTIEEKFFCLIIVSFDETIFGHGISKFPPPQTSTITWIVDNLDWIIMSHGIHDLSLHDSNSFQLVDFPHFNSRSTFSNR